MKVQVLLLTFVMGLSFNFLASINTKHKDGRLKLFFPDQLDGKTLLNKNSDKKVLEALSQDYHLGFQTSHLELIEKKKSLLGTHLVYQQMVEGVKIFGAELIVSLNKEGGIFKVYNNTVSASYSEENAPLIPMITEKKAIERAWKYLKVNGEFLAKPKVKLGLNKGKMAMVYRVHMSTSSPFGHWLVHINAINGNILKVEQESLERIGKRRSPQQELFSRKRKAGNLKKALAKITRKTELNDLPEVIIHAWKKGQGVIFDPNPVTTLMRDDLENTTDDQEFIDAYKVADLGRLRVKKGKVHLEGKRVKLIDFETPNIAPSVSETGEWKGQRKDLSFNDVMTYYHIDQSIKYLEGLGYIDEKVIFPKALEVDANGVDGADNSHYIPSVKRLAFGHGCVADNEDSDVILHELGHAINHHINPRWSGGDTGAMGEGFGDYWAASYSVSKENGLEFKPNWVFKWDGHNSCWGGRKLNAMNAQYHHSHNHYAHAHTQEGENTDELWSTPIFQAFLELYKEGVKREVMDTIIIEAQFGLGAGLKMRDMANSIIKTAKNLHSDKDYHEVYAKHFKRHGIVK